MNVDKASRIVTLQAIDDAILAISGRELDRGMRKHGWSPSSIAAIAAQLAAIRAKVEGESLGHAEEVNAAMWFDFAGISLQASDELMEAVYRAEDAYNRLVLKSRES